ncbi:MAG: tRNA (adenosine(37)-N6)-threonylcarbamoyltransferase complex ATPase subunit type 1 TsaE [Phycisphaerae bacterium]|nr:tRNA (adenosine(37)-N6)-threonylcarbamoyltransferase complex ATPase subunit type 1 TsaE [Phycisphaerae bacterium]
MTDTTVIHANSVAETLELGRRIGAVLDCGWVIGLVGDLGVGKTHLVKGIAEGFRAPGTAAVEVTSPTFVLVNEYPGRGTLYHLDAYRLHCGEGLEELGIEEMIACGAVVIEWADRVADGLPGDHLTIAGRSTGATLRVWTLCAGGPVSREWLARIS